MRSRIFGWSYPPGCSGPPDDDPICEICGQNPETGECICPECPVCNNYGDPDCYVSHGLRRSELQKFYRETADREQKEFYEPEY